SQRRFIDAPVSGGVVGAEAGSLTIMAAGPRADFEVAAPVLKAMGSRIYHVGQKAGDGAMVKTINQLLCGVHIAAAAEALALGERA
ncbi:NAD(P)-binding domain-containing protein, partial [Acinetobacter baumannii]